MNIEEVRDYCMSKKGTTEEFPFDELTLVFKVLGKMYALTRLEGDFYINLKCDPERAVTLREEHEAIQPGYHMNKKHWNSVYMDGRLKTDLVKQLIDESYNLVASKLTKKQKEELANM